MSVDIGQLLQEHSKLFSSPMTVLGELHYRILKSVEIAEDKKEKDKEFAREIGRDEIHWWVFYKETNRVELKTKTKEVLESSQKLKEDSIKIRDSLRPKFYSKLIEGMTNFCIEHQEAIQNVLNYVIWLEKKDPCAPSILFTYRVWGSTRMGDRTIRLHKKDEKTAINKCIEIALGLRNFSRGAVVGNIFNDISYEIYQSLDPEDYDKPIVISEEAVASRSSTEILREMAEYFEFLRNSLRNILLEIGEYEISDNIIHDNKFWKSFVRKVMEQPVETMMWDFKETLAMWETQGTMKKKKEVEFCEDIASFANRRGGILIIGISNKLPRKVIGLEDLENKIKYAKDVIQKGISYPRDLTHFQVLALEDEADEKKLCLLVVVKQSMDAVGVNNEKVVNTDDMRSTIITPTYPIRNETGITRVSPSDVSNAKAHLKHDSYGFLTSLETNYTKKSN